MSRMQRDVMLRRAQNALASNHLTQASTICEQLIRTNPRNVPTLNLLGRIAFARSFYAEAAGYLEKAAAIQPRDIQAPLTLAELRTIPSSVAELRTIPSSDVAGVRRVVMVVAAPGGQINPLVLAAADLTGVDEIYRIGGAQAVGALAFGTPTIARVDKIVGPGNVYVAAAKRQVFGIVGIDMIAGPSEILVVADRFNDPAWIAADLLAQAEHDIAAQAILVADDKDFAEAVTEAIQVHLSTLPRAGIAAQSWETFGAVILMESLADAGPLIDRIAPEHLELAVEEPETLAATVCNAGAIFLGRFAPEAIGDYVAGPNHVLPTAGSARFSSGLGVLDFLKRTSLIGCNRESLAAVAPAAVALAKAEGLDAHALSLAIRLNRPQDT